MRTSFPVRGMALAMTALLGPAGPMTAETYAERQQAQIAQAQQADIAFAGNCFATSKVLTAASPGAARAVYGEDGEEAALAQEVFWTTYLTRLEALGPGPDQAQMSQMIERLEADPEGTAAALAPVWTQCTKAHDYLTKTPCGPDTVSDTVPYHIPMNSIGLAKICRESAQMAAEWQPKESVRESPEDLSYFNKQRHADRMERDFFDRLLASQAAPQCPAPQALFSAAAYPEERGQVEEAYRDWLGKIETQDEITNSQMPYIQWQTSCRRLKEFTGFKPQD